MNDVYLVLGALTFWTLVAAATLVASVAVAEWSRGRKRQQIETIVDPFTEEQTSKLVREWREGRRTA